MAHASYLEKKGIASWLLTVDHKRIALLYLFTILTFFPTALLHQAMAFLKQKRTGTKKSFSPSAKPAVSKQSILELLLV